MHYLDCGVLYVNLNNRGLISHNLSIEVGIRVSSVFTFLYLIRIDACMFLKMVFI